MQELGTRLITAFFLILLTAFVLYQGGNVLLLAALICFAGINIEFYRNIKGLNPRQLLLLFLLNLFIPASYLFGGWLYYGATITVVAIILASIMTVWMARTKHPIQAAVIGELWLGFCYCGIIGSLLSIAADVNNANLYLTWVITSVALCDTCAYLGGSKIGGPKLAPDLSPNKTVSGSYSGLVGAAIGSVVSGLIMEIDYSIVTLCAFGLLIGVLGQLGDLFESLIKRRLGIKDFSNILPGHGGLLDRLDAIIFALPVVLIASGAWK